jgi:hypothetical protein
MNFSGLKKRICILSIRQSFQQWCLLKWGVVLVNVQDMQRRSSWGHIINMVGLSGHRIPDAPAGGTFFAATKFAVKALTEGLRQEVRRLWLEIEWELWRHVLGEVEPSSACALTSCHGV